MTMPTHITHAQRTAAVEALGLDPNIVRTLSMDASTDDVTVTVYVLNADGRKVLEADDDGETWPAVEIVTIPVCEPTGGEA